jgi:hypothetical protein
LIKGDIVSAERIARLKTASDQLSVAWETFLNKINDSLLPLLTVLIEEMTRYVEKIKVWKTFGVEALKLAIPGVSSMAEFRLNTGMALQQFVNGIAEIDSNKENAKKKTQRDIENAIAGPNIPDTNKKGFRFAVDESVFGSNSKLAGPKAMELYQSTGGFAGSDMRMISSVNVETNMILKQQLAIQKKILEESAKFALNTGADIMSIFGIGK